MLKEKYRPSSKEILRTIKNLLLIIVGTALLAFGVSVFIVPFDIVAGGVAGIAIVLKYIIPFDIGVDVYIGVLTWALFIAGFFILGKRFALKTLICSLSYPILLHFFMKLVDPDVLGGFFYLAGSEYSGISILLAAIFGGAFTGAACALTFLGGGSTGGTDVITFTICKIFKRAKSSIVIFVMDSLIVIAGMFAIGDMVVSLLGVCSALVCAVVVDYVFIGSSKAFVANIVSDHVDEINKEIIKKLNRGTTIMDAFGGYTGNKKKVLYVSFTIRQYSDLMALVRRVDKNAFVTVSRAHEINGKGFSGTSDAPK
jgi:uncharacterized membrane-anchored protein YitT (DUF2179 family)